MTKWQYNTGETFEDENGRKLTVSHVENAKVGYATWVFLNEHSTGNTIRVTAAKANSHLFSGKWQQIEN